MAASIAVADLVAFLRDRLDEDERSAQFDNLALDEGWYWHDSEDGRGYPIPGAPTPARVLAEVEAKRRIIREFEQEISRGPAGDREDFMARHDGILDAYRAALRMLIQPYADHSDFDPAWRI